MSITTKVPNDQCRPPTNAKSKLVRAKVLAGVLLVATPVAALIAAVTAVGVDRTLDFVVQLTGLANDDAALLVFGLPFIWIMISPVFVVPGAMRRPSAKIRSYWTEQLAATYHSSDLVMATGAHNGYSFDVRDIDERVVATVRLKANRDMQIQIESASDSEALPDAPVQPLQFEVTWRREPLPGDLISSLCNQILEVYPNDGGTGDAAELLASYFCPPQHRDAHVFTLQQGSRLTLQPNPPAAFPNRYDIVADDGSTKGQVILPGKLLFRGVIVISNELPPAVRALLAALCYRMMKSN